LLSCLCKVKEDDKQDNTIYLVFVMISFQIINSKR